MDFICLTNEIGLEGLYHFVDIGLLRFVRERQTIVDVQEVRPNASQQSRCSELATLTAKFRGDLVVFPEPLEPLSICR